MARLESELTHLFGHDIAEQSKQLTIPEIFAYMDVIPFMVSRLSQLKGNTMKQRKYIKGLSKKKAKALCYWIREV